MTKLLALLAAITQLLHRVLDAIGERQIRKQQADYDETVEDIRTDPIGHAQREYGRVRDSDTEAPGMPGSEAERSGDQESQRPGNHPG